jgi:hypothetical protein
MMTPKEKGDRAELIIAADLGKRGYRIAFPYGDNWPYDLILCRQPDLFERIEIKYTESNGEVVRVRGSTHSTVNGHRQNTRKYTNKLIDWLAVYDATSDNCYYICADDLGEGMAEIALRLCSPKNGRRKGVRWASEYTEI